MIEPSVEMGFLREQTDTIVYLPVNRFVRSTFVMGRAERWPPQVPDALRLNRMKAPLGYEDVVYPIQCINSAST